MKTQLLQTLRRASLLTAALPLLIQVIIPIKTLALDEIHPQLMIHEKSSSSSHETPTSRFCVFKFSVSGLTLDQVAEVTITSSTDTVTLSLPLYINESGIGDTKFVNDTTLAALPNGEYSATLSTETGSKLPTKQFTVSCGSITVYRQIDNNDGKDYTNEDSAISDFLWGLSDEPPTRSINTSADKLAPGTYTINTNTVPGYNLTGWFTGAKQCTNPNGTELPSSIVISGKNLHITLCSKKLTDQTSNDPVSNHSLSSNTGPVDQSEVELTTKSNTPLYGLLAIAPPQQVTNKNSECADNDCGVRIYGYKFHDINENGKYDKDEEKLSGWEISICEIDPEGGEYYSLRDCRGEVASAITNLAGEYSFVNRNPNTRHLVCKTSQPEWKRTMPKTSDCQIVNPGPDKKDCEALFGNVWIKPGKTKGESTPPPSPQVLANTGLHLSQGLLVGLSIAGAASGVTYISRRKEYLP